jgi:transcriptional regulator with XRE-family HTH domain
MQDASEPLELTDLGKTLRELRVRSGWTLEELAQKVSLSKSYLSRLEEGDRQPSLAALLALSRAFDVSLGALFPEGRERRETVVARCEEGRAQTGNGLTYTPLSRRSPPVGMQPMRVIVSANRIGDEQYQHEGEEWLYVLSGTLQLTLSSETYTLRPGDAAHFDAREPHRLAALYGKDADLIIVACSTPRSLFDSYR